MPDQIQNPNINSSGQGLPPVIPPVPNPVSATPNPIPAAENPAAAAAQPAQNSPVEPVPLPKVTGVEKPVEPAVTSAAEAVPVKEEVNPLFEKPVIVAPGANSEQRTANSEQRKLPKGVIAGIAALVFLVSSLVVIQNVTRSKSNFGLFYSQIRAGQNACATVDGVRLCRAFIPGTNTVSGWVRADEDHSVSEKIEMSSKDAAQNRVEGPSIGRQIGSNKQNAATNETKSDFSQSTVTNQQVYEPETNEIKTYQPETNSFVSETAPPPAVDKGGGSSGNACSGNSCPVSGGNWVLKCSCPNGPSGYVNGQPVCELNCSPSSQNSVTPGNGTCEQVDLCAGGTNAGSCGNPSDPRGGGKSGLLGFVVDSDCGGGGDGGGGVQESAGGGDTGGGGETGTNPTATATPVTISANCQSLVAQMSDGAGGWVNKTDAEFVAAVRPGDRVRFVCTGHKTQGNFTKSAFFINNVLHVDDVVKLNDTQFAVEYTIPAAGELKVESVLLHDTKGWVD